MFSHRYASMNRGTRLKYQVPEMLATGGTERRLLQTVVENATWKCGVLQTKLFEPFEILRHSNHESSRNEKENDISALQRLADLPRRGISGWQVCCQLDGSRIDLGGGLKPACGVCSKRSL